MTKIQRVDLVAFRCECRNCGKTSEVYDLDELIYGSRILWTEDGIDFGYIDTFNDRIFEEVSKIVDDFYKGKNISTLKIAEYFNTVFGLACDPINGKNINALRGYACKNCGSDNVEAFDYQPVKDVELEVPVITHILWEKKNIFERKMIINKALEEKCK